MTTMEEELDDNDTSPAKQQQESPGEEKKQDDEEEEEEQGDSDGSSGGSSSSSSLDDESSDDDDDSPPPPSAKVVTTEDGHVISEYELMRLERIKRNREHLERLGLAKKKNATTSSSTTLLGEYAQEQQAERKRRKEKQQQQQQSISKPEKRRLSSRARKDISYREKPLRAVLGDVLSPTKKERQRSDNNNNGNASATNGDRKTNQRMDLHIYREFKRVNRSRIQNLKDAKRNVRLAETEYRHAKKHADKYEREKKRQSEYERVVKSLAKEREHLGCTLREMSDHFDKRKYSMMGAQNFYEQEQKSHEEAANFAHYRQLADLKMEMIDALDRFPLAIKEAQNTLDMLLVERLPEDPPLPRKSGRKRNYSTITEQPQQSPLPLPAPPCASATANFKKIRTVPDNNHDTTTITIEPLEGLPIGSAPNATKDDNGSNNKDANTKQNASQPTIPTDNTTTAAQPTGETTTTTRGRPKKEFPIRNVGGWVSPDFSRQIDRSWLEKESVPLQKPFDVRTYVPQVGDMVLYYPAGHQQFLKAHPDVLGSRAKNKTMLPLWVRAAKERNRAERHLAVADKENKSTDEGDTNVTAAAADSSKKENNNEKPIKVDRKTAVKRWWTDEWLSNIHGDLGKWPLLCRVERTHAQFPQDPNHKTKIVKKDEDGVQITWEIDDDDKKIKGKKNKISSSTDRNKKKKSASNQKTHLCAVLQLRPLTGLLPPGWLCDGESPFTSSSKTFIPPPAFNIATFPSKKVGPYVVPFAWAYKKSQSLSIGDAVETHSDNRREGNIHSFSNELRVTPLGERLDDLSAWFADVFANSDPLLSVLDKVFPTATTTLKAAQSSSSAASSLSDLHAVAFTMMRLLQDTGKVPGSSGTTITNARIIGDSLSGGGKEISIYISLKEKGSLESRLKDIILSTLPLWRSIEVRNEEAKKKYMVSCWDIVNGPLSEASLTTTTVNTMDEGSSCFLQALSELQGLTAVSKLDGPVSTFEESLRAKIEFTLDEFIEKTPDLDFFYYPVHEDNAPNYFCAVPLGMWLERIMKRLRLCNNEVSCYYRSVDAMLSDVYDIGYNCALYNSPDSEIIKQAQEVLPALKAELTRVAVSHQREKQTRKRADEERRKLVLLQCSNLRKNEAKTDDHGKKKTRRKRMEDSPFFGPFDGSLHRDWIERIESGVPPSSRESEATDNTSRANLLAKWLPQCSDEVLYNRSVHEKFVKGHYQSLRIDQCKILEMSTDNGDRHKGEWVRGKVVWVRAAFPQQAAVTTEGKENSCFDLQAPLVSVGIQFQQGVNSRARVHEIFWRPCSMTPSKTPIQSPAPARNTRNRGKKKKAKPAPIPPPLCPCCGVDLCTSFLQPTWLCQERKSTENTGDDLNCTPQGIGSSMIASIDRCLCMLKRRCMGDIPPDYVDPKFCLANVKQGVYPVSSAKLDTPSFEDFFRREDKEAETSQVIPRTRGRQSTRESDIKLLAMSHYLPSWSAAQFESEKAASSKKYSTFSPHPKLCLEMIQLRLRKGYYRHTAALVHDIQEAYVSSVILAFMTSRPRKKGKPNMSLRKLARSYLMEHVGHEPSDPALGALPTSSSPKKKKGVPVKPPKPKKVKVHLKPDEQAYKATIDRVRKMYATVLACVLNTRVFEKVFGLAPKPKLVERKTEVIIGSEVEQERALVKNKIAQLLKALGRDPCNNRLRPITAAQIIPQIKLKVTCNGKTVRAELASADKSSDAQTTANNTEDSNYICKLSFMDYNNNLPMAQAIFGRKNLMNACARCQAFKRSFPYCRVIKSHSNPDFDWFEFFKKTQYRGTHGIDQMILKIHPTNTISAFIDPVSHVPINGVSALVPASGAASHTTASSAKAAVENSSTDESTHNPTDVFLTAETALLRANAEFEKAKAESERPLRMSDEFIKSYLQIDEDGHYYFCYVCGLIGDVLCCESCPNVAHAKCAGLEEVPEEDWFCEKCEKKNTGIRKDARTIEETDTHMQDKGSESRSENVNDDEEVENAEETFSKNANEDDQEALRPLEEILEELRALREKSSRPPAQSKNEAVVAIPAEQEEATIKIGARIVKSFGKLGDFTGSVIELASEENPFYRIRYEDGDEEDMSIKELKESMIKEGHVDEVDEAKSNAPAGRGSKKRRGRPRKVDSESPGSALSGTKKKRGRPRKVPIEADTKSPKRRGVPIKRGVEESKSERKNESDTVIRPHGRPRKRLSTQDVEFWIEQTELVTTPEPVKGGKGRSTEETGVEEDQSEAESDLEPSTRKHGRRRKRRKVEEVSVEDRRSSKSPPEGLNRKDEVSKRKSRIPQVKEQESASPRSNRSGRILKKPGKLQKDFELVDLVKGNKNHTKSPPTKQEPARPQANRFGRVRKKTDRLSM